MVAVTVEEEEVSPLGVVAAVAAAVEEDVSPLGVVAAVEVGVEEE